jgi:hypothetical protein
MPRWFQVRTAWTSDHIVSCRTTSLEEMFDPARVKPDYTPRGWTVPGVTTRPVVGHTFGLSLNAEDRIALLAFLRNL